MVRERPAFADVGLTSPARNKGVGREVFTSGTPSGYKGFLNYVDIL